MSDIFLEIVWTSNKTMDLSSRTATILE